MSNEMQYNNQMMGYSYRLSVNEWQKQVIALALLAFECPGEQGEAIKELAKMVQEVRDPAPTIHGLCL